MVATYDYIAQKFEEFNALIFEGELPAPIFLPSKARSYLGRYECDVRRRPFRQPERYNHRIRINTAMDFPENEIEDILIHEMIHYYISYKNLRDTSTHGEIFRKMMAGINDRFGRHISISVRRTEEMAQADTRLRRHNICAMTLPDGRRAFTPVTVQSMFKLWTLLPEAFEATEYAWFGSFDPFFNAYRKLNATRTPSPRLRTYPVEAAALEQALATAVRLKREGRRIVPVESAG